MSSFVKNLALLFSLALSACVSSSPATNDRIETPTSTPSIEIEPEVNHLCPPDRLVSLSQLGLPPDFQIVIRSSQGNLDWDADGEGLFVYNPATNSPDRLEKLYADEYLNSSRYLLSPDGKWILFFRKSLADDSMSTWIASTGGGEVSQLEELQDLPIRGWVDNEFVAILDSRTPQGISEVAILPTTLFNPFTAETIKLIGTPEVQVFGMSGLVFRYQGKTFLMFQDENDYWLLDYSTQKTEKILRWLDGESLLFDSVYANILEDGEIVLIVARDEGLELSIPMDPQLLLSENEYGVEMQSVSLPTDLLPARFAVVDQNGKDFGFYGNLEEDFEDPYTPFYWYDSESGSIMDYCLDVKDIFPDSQIENFIAFSGGRTRDDNTSWENVLILNLETGYFSEIPNYQLVGWAKTEASH